MSETTPSLAQKGNYLHANFCVNLRVDCIERPTPGVAVIRLSGTDLPDWTPGAHIDLRLPGGLIRSYSLCGQHAPDHYEIAVLHEEEGRGGSRYIHATLAVGEVVASTFPTNHFELVEGGHYIFIAGGIGITPLLTMARHATAESKSWEFHYLGRSRSTMAFIPELSALAAAAGAPFDIIARDEDRRAVLADILAKAGTDAQLYCCGPSRLLDEIETLAEGMLSDRLHVERFGRLARDETAVAEGASPSLSEPGSEMGSDDLLSDPDGAFEVELRKSGVVLEVGAGETILGCARKVRQGLSFSCSDGYCGTCETRVLSGLPDHRDSVLTDAEKAANRTMMICVGRSRSKRLVLDL